MQLSENMLEKLHAHRELIVTSFVILICLFLAAAFPTENAFQSISKNIFFLLVIPILYLKFILKKELVLWGWNLRNKKLGVILGGLNLLSGLAIFYLILRFTTFSQHYTLNPLVNNSFAFFLLYELVFFNLYFFTQEFFFKGFILFSFKEFLAWSILIQSIIYFVIILFSSSILLQNLPLIFLSLAGGFVSYKTHSFFYSYISGLLFIIILDAYIIHLVK